MAPVRASGTMRQFNLFRIVLVQAVILAVAVIIPLRRAQRAFATYAATPAVHSAARPVLRRRPSRLRTVSLSRLNSAKRTVAILAGSHSAGPRMARRRLTDSTPPQHSPAEKQAPRHTPPATHHDSDCILNRVTRMFQPEQFFCPAGAPRLASATQAVAEIPDPPPKRASL